MHIEYYSPMKRSDAMTHNYNMKPIRKNQMEKLEI